MRLPNLMFLVIALMLCNIFTSSAQTAPAAPAINLAVTNYKLLKQVAGKDEAQPVKALAPVTAYDIKTAPGYYEDEYETYFVSFVIPNGQTLAAYDKTGKLLRTAEKYEIELLPTSITNAIAKKYPNWVIEKDVYLVTDFAESKEGVSKYKIVLDSGTKRMKVKANDAGELF